jgi:DNA invertase Pin-like site-specific DNA recombinase
MATPGRPIDERDRERIRRLGQQGVRVSEIARREMVSRPTVRKILQNSR